jgi:hypothetical protein
VEQQPTNKTHFTEGSFAKSFEWTVRNVVLALVAVIGVGISLWGLVSADGGAVEPSVSSEAGDSEPISPTEDDEAPDSGLSTEGGDEESEEEGDKESEPTASSTTLDRLEPVEGANFTQTGTAAVNGGSYPNSVYWGLGGNSSTVTYQLSRQYNKLTAVGGITDDSGTSAATVMRFYDDDEALIAEYELSLAMQADIDVPLEGVHRLRIELSPSGYSGVESGHAALGTARLD